MQFDELAGDLLTAQTTNMTVSFIIILLQKEYSSFPVPICS